MFDRLAMMLVLLVLAAPVTYLEVVHPSLDSARDALHITSRQTATTDAPRKQPSTTAPDAAGSTTPTTKPADSTAAGSAVSSPTTTPKKTATTTTLVHFRAQKSTSSENLGDIPEGSTVQLRDDADTTWQGVTYQGKDGYIYSSYLKF